MNESYCFYFKLMFNFVKQTVQTKCYFYSYTTSLKFINMEDKLAILKFYGSIVEAEVDVNVLNTNNIDCTLDTDDTVVIYPFFDEKEKGIKLYVFERDLERAALLIQEFHASADNLSLDDE